MKILKLIITTLIILQTILLSAQKYSFISKDLHLMTDKEMLDNEVQITSDLIMYNVEGNTIEPSQINDIMISGNFVPEIFGDKNHQAKIMVFRATTKEEKEEIRNSMQMNDPNANFVAGQFAKDFSATTINGDKVSLNNLKGKVVVLTFWYTQCQPCVAEMPKLNELVKKYKNAAFVSVTFDKKETVKQFLTKHKFNYKHITDNETILSDYETLAFPTHLIIDQKGEIIFRKVGAFIDEMDIKIGLLLK